jgi:site-specific recombinase XerD
MNRYRSFLAHFIEAYVAYRITSERWNESSYGPNLLLFDRYCHRQYPHETTLSQEMANGWCRKRDTEDNNSCRSRIYVVISFIQYLKHRGKTDIAVPTVPRWEKRTYLPHTFTETELHNFFNACDHLSGKSTPEERIRKISVPVFFRLLYSSGIRTN